MAQAVARGEQLEAAAKVAGYNLPYARKISKEPAFTALVEKLREAATPSPEERSIIDHAWSIINDPTSGNQERVSAMRVLIAYDRAHADDRSTAQPVIIIDDIPNCEKCPRTGSVFEGAKEYERQGEETDR